MVCKCNTKSISNGKLKKPPNRQPPAPPPPPREHSSLSHVFNQKCRLQILDYSGAESECCSEGIQSVASVPYSTRSLQPPRRSFSPVSHCGFNSASSTSEYCTSSGCHSIYHTPCYTPNRCHASRYAVSCCGDMPNERFIQSRPPPPPKPKERITLKERPRISTSPEPIVKKPKVRQSCLPGHYKNHMELYIQKLFKYLADRQKRLEANEDKIITNDVTASESIRNIFALSESSYLRAMRVRYKAENFIPVKLLGSGFMGLVFLVKKHPDCKSLPDTSSNLYAMKQLAKKQVYDQNHMAHVMAERDIMAESKNDWIVKLYCSFQDDNHLYFILEYVPGGDMMNLLILQIVFPKEWAKFYIAEIALAVQFVHDMKFIHRDIKPDNILIDRRGHIKLTDFGLCTGFRWTHDTKYNNMENNVDENCDDDHPTITRKLTQREIVHQQRRGARSLVGSPNYIAPEVLRQERKNEKLCDWWSVGVILYEMVVAYCPFIDLDALRRNEYNPAKDDPKEIQKRILDWKQFLTFPMQPPYYIPLQRDRYGTEYPLSNDTIDLIRGLLCDPENRLCQNGVEDLQRHPFFEGIDWRNIRDTRPPFVPELEDDFDTRYFEQSNMPLGDRQGTLDPQDRMLNGFTFRAFMG